MVERTYVEERQEMSHFYYSHINSYRRYITYIECLYKTSKDKGHMS